MATVLVVDDERTIRELVAAVLRDEGYAVVEAADGRAALAALAAAAPDLVLMDVMMPGLDGPATARAMADGTGGGQAVPVVLMSAVTPPAGLPGVTAFLPKPFHLDTLLALVARALAAP